MERFTKVVRVIVMLIALLFITALFTVLFSRDIEPGLTPPLIETEQPEPKPGASYTLEQGFFVYAEPDIRAEKISYLEPETVRVVKLVDSWMLAETSVGEYWLEYEGNRVFIPRFANVYERQKKEGYSETIPPGEYEIVEKGRFDWFLLRIGGSAKWADISEYPERLEITAPLFNQIPEHYNGCESYAAAMAINALGFEIAPKDFIRLVPQNITERRWENGKLIWGDPNKEFVGSMSRYGYAAYPPVIEKAVNDNFGESLVAADISGADYTDITEALSRGSVVLIWFHPSGLNEDRPESWTTEEGVAVNADFGTHTVAVVGYDLGKGTLIFNDSIGAVRQEVLWSEIEPTFAYTGRKALVISLGK